VWGEREREREREIVDMKSKFFHTFEMWKKADEAEKNCMLDESTIIIIKICLSIYVWAICERVCGVKCCNSLFIMFSTHKSTALDESFCCVTKGGFLAVECKRKEFFSKN
jgi:hypothetical protein